MKHTVLEMAGEIDGKAFVQLFVPGAGCAHVSLARETAWLRKLWVYPSSRRIGVGAELFDTAVKIARDAGKLALTWTVKKTNRPAIRFYESRGGQVIEDREDGYYLMSLALKRAES